MKTPSTARQPLFGVLVLLLGTAVLGACATPAPGPYRIQLGARQFSPEPMDGAAIVAELRKSALARDRFILQLDAVPDLRQRRELEDLGITLLHPLPGTAWLASVPADLAAAQLERLSVRWVGALQRDDRLSPAFASDRLGEHAQREAGRVEVLIKLFADADSTAVVARLQELGVRVRRDVGASLRVIVASIPRPQLSTVAELDGVRLIEPTLPPGGPEADRARAYVHADPVQADGVEGSGVTVGVLEGEHAYAAHPDFGGRAAQGDGGAVFYDPQTAHATMTAGMIGGDGTLSLARGGGALQWRGVAPDATLRSYSFEDAVDSTTNYMGDVQDAVQNDGVDVANNSWGDFGCDVFPYGSYAGRAPFLDGVVRGSFGRRVPVVFSAGNERQGVWDDNAGVYVVDCIDDVNAPFENYLTLNHPKSAKNILAVGAVDSASDRASTYSSWGPTLDGRLKPEVVAAGQHDGTVDAGVSVVDNLFGLVVDPFGNETYGNPNQQGYRVPYRFDPNNPNAYRYGWFFQTSAAAAATSGVYALLLDAWREEFPARPDPLPSTLKALVVHTARDLDDGTSTWHNRGPDYASGYGAVDAQAAVAAVTAGEALEAEVEDGATDTYYLAVVANTASLKITLAWDDAPALENANPALVNDLDLVVTAPDGTRHYPWTLDPAVPAAAAVRTQEDHANNLEQVQVAAPASGTWEVRIVGHHVPEGPQLYSVVADNGPVRGPVDLILALDVSDSMNSAPPGGGVGHKIDLLRQAVELFLQTWSLHAVEGDRLGLVYFSSNLSSLAGVPPLLQPFQTLAGPAIDDVRIVNASGCTAMGAALQEVFDSFAPVGGNKRVVILFSDGMQSIDPYIAEEGAPARLKIKSFAAGEPLPFGAFRCSASTAAGLDGAASTPDGEFIDAHGATIHTIGTGVSGAGFETLIERIATETEGLHHFTSQPDAELDLFYTEDLVQSLKSATLEIVRADSGELQAGASQGIEFPVNATARNLTLVLSWKGALAHDAVSLTARTPAGQPAVAAEVRRGRHYTVARFDRDRDPQDFTGNWTVELRNQAGQPLAWQQSVLVDEEACFSYGLDYDRTAHLAGQPIHVTARLSEFGRPLTGADRVQVRVTSPLVSRGNLLAQWLPLVQQRVAKQPRPASLQVLQRFSGQTLRVGPQAVVEARVRALGREPEFVEQLQRRTARTVTLVDNGERAAGDWRAADGIYSGFIANTAVVGPYDLMLTVETGSACGSVGRTQRATLQVQTAAIELPQSDVQVEQLADGIRLRLRPVDRLGNLLGPGRGHEVQVDVEGARPLGEVADLMDGRYEQRFRIERDLDPIISLRVGAAGQRKPLYKGRLSGLVKGASR